MSAFVISIAGSNAISALMVQKSTGEIPHFSSLLISSKLNLGSNKDISSKALTTKPDLNLLFPLASTTSIVVALVSKRDSEVSSSKVSILFSNADISRIVNLLLSLRVILGVVIGLKRKAGKATLASSIASSDIKGGRGLSEDSPWITSTCPKRFIVTISTLGR